MTLKILYGELNELNNTISLEKEITSPLPPSVSPDLSVSYSDIVFSGNVIAAGETLTIDTMVHNTGTDTGNVLVLTYLGDPLNGGVQIGSSNIADMPSNSTASVQTQWLVDKPAGYYNIYIWADPYNSIPEENEDNNIAFNTLSIREKWIPVDVTTDNTQYQANSDAGINVYLQNNDLASLSATGEVYIEDTSGNQVAHVATFSVDDLSSTGITGWTYRIPTTVTAGWDMKDALSEVTVDFISVLQSLGISDKFIDKDSIRVLEFDGTGSFIGEKQARTDFLSDTLAEVIWLLDGITINGSTRYFSVYFDITDNGSKEPSSNTNLHETGRFIAYTDNPGNIYFMESRYDGTFSAPVIVADITESTYELPRGIVLEDFNNDGSIDIITGSYATGEVYYFQNTAVSPYSFEPKTSAGFIPDAGDMEDFAAADFNNDGNMDFVTNRLRSTVLYLFEGNGDGTFNQSIISDTGTKHDFLGKTASDIDKDGNADLLVGNNYGIINFFKGNGDGTFQTPVQIDDIGSSTYGLITGDFDEDGEIDIIANDGKVLWEDHGYTFFLKGNGDGTFEAALHINSLDTGVVTTLDTGDFNNDGHLDVINSTSSATGYYPGNGDGTFGVKSTLTTGTSWLLGISSSPALPEVHPVLGSPELMPSIAYDFVWNTGNTPPGNYNVHVTLSETGGVIAGGYASFEILPDISVDSSVVTDKIEYNPNETALISSTITSQSENTIFDNLSATVTIKDSADTELYSETNAISILLPGQLKTFNTYWNTSTYPSGDYPVTLEVKDSSGTVLSSSTTNLTISNTIDPSKLLIGQISVDQQSLLQGDTVNIDYSLTNVGNIDLSQVDITIPIVHVIELTPYDTLTDQTALLMGDTYNNAQPLGTQTYTAKDYLVILRAGISGVEETLASTYFRVEGMPSAPSLNWPTQGEDIEILTPELVVNNASDPNDDDLTYEFELYSDSGLLNLVASSGVIDEEEGTTSWLVPIELEENAVYYWRARAYDGLLYGYWMTPASFRVNLLNDPPTAPTLSSPAHDSEVDTFTPVLTVNNASDPDSGNLTYNFEMALDIDFTQITASQVGIFEGNGTTSWQVPVSLDENTYYYWRAQADDWLIEGPWMTPAGFFVNTANDAPTTPSIIAPADGSEITTLSVDIIAANSTDPDNDPLSYIFELDTVNTFDSADLRSSGNVAEGQDTTSWFADALSDNTYYYVRAKASDSLADSSWSNVTDFFVNTVNEAPTVPILANPSDGGAVIVFTPELSVHNSSDIDRDLLTYEFEIYADEAMTVPVDSASNVQETPDITAWTVSVSLAENEIYYWRARAFDGELYSIWMIPASFMVNTANDAPGVPSLNSPADGSTVDTLNPALSVHNASDPDSDILSYDFEIYSEGTLVQSITGIPEGISGITSIILAEELSDNTIYTWRARAYDGDRYGAWMNMAEFSVHLPILNITGTIDFDPNTLNKKSKGKWVVVYIELPDGYNVEDIVVSSILLEGTIPAEPWPYNIGDEDNDGIPDLMVKFRRADVIDILPLGDNVIVNVTGDMQTIGFEGFDIIRVID